MTSSFELHSFVKQPRVIYSFFVVIAVITFYDAINFDFLLYDDQNYVNELINNDKGIMHLLKWGLGSIVNANWSPVTLISLIVDYKLYGDFAGGYHITNLIIHVLNTFLVFSIFNSITTSKAKGFLIATIFLLHPLNVEAFAWISERKGVLAAFFMLAATRLYLNYLASKSVKYYILAIGLFLLSLMSKAVFVTLPFILIFIEYSFLKKITDVDSHGIKKILINQTPFFLASLLVGIATLYAHSVSGALYSNDVYTINEKIVKTFIVIPIYIRQIFYPVDLYAPYMMYTPEKYEFYLAVTLTLSVSIAAIYYAKKIPCLFFGWFSFLILSLPILGLVQSGFNMHADRYMYIPAIGIYYILVVTIMNFMEKYAIKNSIKLTSYSLLLLLFMFTSHIQFSYWRNTFTLFYNTLKYDKNNLPANVLLAAIYVQVGDLKKAMHHYQTTRNKSEVSMTAYYNVAKALVDYGYMEQTLIVLKDALNAITSIKDKEYFTNNNDAEKRDYLIYLFYKYLKSDKIGVLIDIIKKKEPENTKIRFVDAIYKYDRHDYTGYVNVLREIININPMQKEAYLLLVKHLHETKQYNKSEEIRKQALKLFPKEINFASPNAYPHSTRSIINNLKYQQD